MANKFNPGCNCCGDCLSCNIPICGWSFETVSDCCNVDTEVPENQSHVTSSSFDSGAEETTVYMTGLRFNVPCAGTVTIDGTAYTLVPGSCVATTPYFCFKIQTSTDPGLSPGDEIVWTPDQRSFRQVNCSGNKTCVTGVKAFAPFTQVDTFTWGTMASGGSCTSDISGQRIPCTGDVTTTNVTNLWLNSNPARSEITQTLSVHTTTYVEAELTATHVTVRVYGRPLLQATYSHWTTRYAGLFTVFLECGAPYFLNRTLTLTGTAEQTEPSGTYAGPADVARDEAIDRLANVNCGCSPALVIDGDFVDYEQEGDPGTFIFSVRSVGDNANTEEFIDSMWDTIGARQSSYSSPPVRNSLNTTSIEDFVLIREKVVPIDWCVVENDEIVVSMDTDDDVVPYPSTTAYIGKQTRRRYNTADYFTCGGPLFFRYTPLGTEDPAFPDSTYAPRITRYQEWTQYSINRSPVSAPKTPHDEIEFEYCDVTEVRVRLIPLGECTPTTTTTTSTTTTSTTSTSSTSTSSTSTSSTSTSSTSTSSTSTSSTSTSSTSTSSTSTSSTSTSSTSTTSTSSTSTSSTSTSSTSTSSTSTTSTSSTSTSSTSSTSTTSTSTSSTSTSSTSTTSTTTTTTGWCCYRGTPDPITTVAYVCEAMTQAECDDKTDSTFSFTNDVCMSGDCELVWCCSAGSCFPVRIPRADCLGSSFAGVEYPTLTDCNNNCI